MYRIRIIQKSGHINTEEYLFMDRAMDRFNELIAKKKKYCLDMDIYLEELIHTAFNEYRVHKIG